jgi:pyruvate kinase
MTLEVPQTSGVFFCFPLFDGTLLARHSDQIIEHELIATLGLSSDGETIQRPRLVLDLQDSKWRLGDFVAFGLEDGQSVELVCAASADRRRVLPVPHPDFFQAVQAFSGEIVLDDARVCLRIESLDRTKRLLGGTRSRVVV